MHSFRSAICNYQFFQTLYSDRRSETINKSRQFVSDRRSAAINFPVATTRSPIWTYNYRYYKLWVQGTVVQPRKLTDTACSTQ